MNGTETLFSQVLEDARKDPNILAFWLDGSRCKAVITPYSDYDCTMIVKETVLDAYREQYENLGNRELELSVLSFDLFRKHAAWGSPEAWDRYNFVRLIALVDKTGEAQKLIDEKALIPPAEIPKVIRRTLDHYVNQIYRSMKCVRDGQLIGARLEAAEGINPLLDAVFALHGRLRPYFKYLEWEFKNCPLTKLDFDHCELLSALVEILASADVKTQQLVLSKIERLFRAEGYGDVLDAWGDKLTWMKEFSS